MKLQIVALLLMGTVFSGCGKKTIITCDEACEAAMAENEALRAFMSWSLSLENTYRGGTGYYMEFVKLSDDKSYAVFKLYRGDGSFLDYRAVKLDGYDTTQVGAGDWNAHIIQGGDYAFADLQDNGDGTFSCDTTSTCWSWSQMNGASDTGDYNMTFTEQNESQKDLELLGHLEENADRAQLAEYLEFNYGLSANRSQKLARMTASFHTIKNKRELSQRDYTLITQEVLGVDYRKAKLALEKHIQGDSSQLDDLIDQAARLNETTPEVVQELVGELFLK